MRRMLAASVVAGMFGMLTWTTVAGAAPPSGPEKVWVTPSAAGTTAKLPGKVMFTGSFADYGKVVTVNASGKPAKNGGYVLLTLKKGSILVNVSGINKAFSSAQPQTNNTTSCSADVQFTAPVTVVKGTKTYVGITGTFTMTAKAAFIGSKTKSGACTEKTTSPAVASYESFTGMGTVSFGSS